MSRVALTLVTQENREKAAKWCLNAPPNSRFELKAPRRSLPQNDRLWAMLTDVSRQLPWHGIKLSTDDWKLIFLDALKREVRLVPNIDGNGFVSLGRSSSDLAVEEFSDLLAIIEAFAAEHGVALSDNSHRADIDAARNMNKKT